MTPKRKISRRRGKQYTSLFTKRGGINITVFLFRSDELNHRNFLQFLNVFLAPEKGDKNYLFLVFHNYYSELIHNSSMIHNFCLMSLPISSKQNAIIGAVEETKCIDLLLH